MRHQKRIDAAGLRKNQNFRLTVESQSHYKSMNVNGNDPISVFYGQSLDPGAAAIFAAIKKIHSPTRRPGSKFKFTIMVRAEMFEAIPISDPVTVREIIETAEQVYETGKEIYEVAESIVSGVENLSETVDNVRRKASAAAEKYAKKFGRDAERLLQAGTGGLLDGADPRRLLDKISADSIKNRIHDAAKDRFKDLFSSKNAARSVYAESFPATQAYDLMFLNTHLSSVTDKMIGYKKDLDKFKADGGALKPDIDPEKEADRLGNVFTALTTILAINGINIATAGLNGDTVEISFAEVKKRRSVTNSQSILKVVGAAPTSIIYLPKGEEPLVLTSGIELVTGTPFTPATPPWNNPRTMAYFFHLQQMYKDGKGGLFGCNDAATSGAISFFVKYTYPTPVVVPSRPKSLISVKMMPSIKSNISKLEEELAALGDQLDSIEWRDDIFKVEQGKTYNINDMLPLGDLCTLKELYDEFLNKFDFPALFCKYAECIPDFPWPPEFKWDFDFTIPDIPDLPTFDPIAFIIPIIEAAIIDLIIAFLCGLVRAILALLKAPSCEDLLDFGALLMSAIMGDDKDQDPVPADSTAVGAGYVAAKAETFKKSQKALEAMDIPSDVLPDAADLFDQISLALTPGELCSLLDGTASAQTLAITKQIIMSSDSNIKDYLDNEDEMSDFFELLGTFIDPAMCEKISRLSNVVVGDDFCFEKDRKPLRQQLLEEGATSDEIARALEDAAKKREAINKLLAENPMKNLLANAGLGDGTGGVPAAGSGCPGASNIGAGAGPYDNPNFSKLAKITTKTILSSVEQTFKFDIKTYVPSFYEKITRPMDERDPEFDLLLHLKFKHLTDQIRATNSAPSDKAPDAPTLYKPGKIATEVIYGELLIGPDGWPIYEGEDNVPKRKELGKKPVGIENGAPYILSQAQLVVPIEEGGPGLDFTITDNDELAKVEAKAGSIIQEEADLLKRLLIEGAAQLFKTDFRIGTKDYSEFYKNDILNSVGIHGDIDYLQISIPEFQAAEIESDIFRLQRPTQNSAVGYREFILGSAPSGDLIDCYAASRTSNTNDMITYTSKVPERFATRRKKAIDITSFSGKFSLRSGAFADMFISSWKRGLDLAKDATVFHLDEQMSESQREDRKDALSLKDEAGLFKRIAFGGWSSHARRGTVADIEDLQQQNFQGDQWWRDTKNGPYSLMVDRFLDKISTSISKSKYFNVKKINELHTRLSQEFIKVPQDDGSFCLKKAPPIIDFEKLIEEVLSDMQDSLCDPKNAPQNRDFSKPGPLEEANLKKLTILYVTTFVVEYVFKQIYIAGRFDVRSAMNEPHVIELVKNHIIREIEKTSASADPIKNKIMEMTNEDDMPEAIEIMYRTLIAPKVGDLFATINENGFQPEWRSYKDEFYHEIIQEYEDELNARLIQDDYAFDPSLRKEDLERGNNRRKIPDRVMVEEFHDLMQPGNRGTVINKLTTSVSRNITQEKGLFHLSQEAGKDLNQGKFYLETYYKLDQDILKELVDMIYDIFGNKKSTRHPNRAMSYALSLFHPLKYKGVFSLRELDQLLLLFAPNGTYEYKSNYKIRSASTIRSGDFNTIDAPAGDVTGIEELEKFASPGSARDLKDRIFNGGVKAGLRLVFIPGVGDMMYANIPYENRKNYAPGNDIGTLVSLTDPRINRTIEDEQFFTEKGKMSGIGVERGILNKPHKGRKRGIPNLDQANAMGSTIYLNDLLKNTDQTARPLRDYHEAVEAGRKTNDNFPYSDHYITLDDFVKGVPFEYSAERHNIRSTLVGGWSGRAFHNGETDVPPAHRTDGATAQDGEYIPVSFTSRFNNKLFGPASELSIVNRSYIASLKSKAVFDYTVAPGGGYAAVDLRGAAQWKYDNRHLDNRAAVLFGSTKLTAMGAPEATDEGRLLESEGGYEDPDTFVYPTPLVEVEVAIECLGEYVNYEHLKRRSSSKQGYSALNNPSCLISAEEADFLENFVYVEEAATFGGFHTSQSKSALADIKERNRNALHDKYFEVLISKMFGYGAKSADGRRTKLAPEAEDMSYLFDFVFPLERYTSLYFNQTLSVMQGEKKLDNMFVPTRGTILRIFNAINNVSSNSLDLGDQGPDTAADNNAVYNTLTSMQMGDGLAPEADISLGDIAAMIAKVILMAVPTLIRGQADFLDSGYKQMSGIFKNNPCELPDGLTIFSLGGAANRLGFGDQPNLSGGQNSSKDSFMPVTIGAPMDIYKGIAWYLITGFPTFFTAGDFRPLLNSVEHIVGSALGGPKSYGAPMLPIGALALMMPQLTGEEASKKLKEANCNEAGQPTATDTDADGNSNITPCED